MKRKLVIVLLLFFKLQCFGQANDGLLESGYYFLVRKESHLKSKNDLIVMWHFFVPNSNLEIFSTSERYESVFSFFKNQHICEFAWSSEVDFFGCCKFEGVSEGRSMYMENKIPFETLQPFIHESDKQSYLLNNHTSRSFKIIVDEFIYFIEVSKLSGFTCNCQNTDGKCLVFFENLTQLEKVGFWRSAWFKRRFKRSIYTREN